MITRVRFAVAPLLIVLLCGAATAVHADRDEERSSKKEERRDSPSIRNESRDRYDDRRGYPNYRNPDRSYPQPGYPSSPRSYPQPGYPNPVTPGYYRHDPYSKQPGRDPYRDDRYRDDRYRGDPRRSDPYRDHHDRDDGYRRDDRERGYDRGDGRNRDDQYGTQARPLRPVNDVVRQVESTYGGKVVGVQQAGNDYRVRVLQRDGRVKTVTVPAH